jgi:hypothetical protein
VGLTNIETLESIILVLKTETKLFIIEIEGTNSISIARCEKLCKVGTDKSRSANESNVDHPPRRGARLI